jgi:predicted nuclease of predicted toxin-antitoxin system
MKILLDECIPRKLKMEFTCYEIKTVPQMGWRTIENGELIKLAENEFDVFITVDRNLTFQQNLINTKMNVLVLLAKDNRLETLKSLLPEILLNLKTLKPNEIRFIGKK